MRLKTVILDLMRRDALKAAIKAAKLGQQVDLRSVESMRAALSKSRRVKPELLLPILVEGQVKIVCERMGVDQTGRKGVLIERLLASEAAPLEDAPQANERSPADSPQPTPSRPAPLAQTGVEAKAPRSRRRKRQIENYAHRDKERVNNPPVGLVTPETDDDAAKMTYQHDPHIDPQLSWAGKAEHTAFEVPTVSLHVHERVDPRTIIEAVRKRNGTVGQLSLFEAPEENPPIRQAIEFYRHRHNWSNRLVAGDSLLVMNSLLEKEGLSGQVQMVYLDPPYGIRYGSNFQPFVHKRDVADGKDEDLTQEPETIRAFRDTWELGIHSYLTYLRDRLLLARELLTDSGSCFVQISSENLHHVRELMDEVFGVKNFASLISYKTTSNLGGKFLSADGDFIVWYAKNKDRMKYRQLYLQKGLDTAGAGKYVYGEFPSGEWRKLSNEELANPPKGVKIFRDDNLTSQSGGPTTQFNYTFSGQVFSVRRGGWKTNLAGMRKLEAADRLVRRAESLNYKRYLDDFPAFPISSSWSDTALAGWGEGKVYVVQTARRVIQRCLLMATDPGDLVFDPTCGSGTTSFLAEQWGRRWITCDTSRVALALARQRLMTGSFDYYELAHAQEGVGSGFRYKTVPHIMLSSITTNPDIREGMTRAAVDSAIARHAPKEALYDQPLTDRSKARVTGPFTVEAVPAPVVKPLETVPIAPPADQSIARSGETIRQSDWRDELAKTGIRGKAGQRISFARIEPMQGTHWLHAEGETRPDARGAPEVRDGTATVATPVVVSFGPDHTPLEQRQVALAIEEAQTLVPRPKIIVFAAFQFDPEAAKDIDETNWPGVTLLKAQMNADLLTDDLKRQRASNESFWLIGQPDVQVETVAEGEDAGKHRARVSGFDYYNTKTGDVESGSEDRIALWMLDTDYDGRSLFPRQVFFPMAGQNDGWAKVARNLKAEIDEGLISAYRGTVSLPFEAGEHCRAAVKIVDDRGIESLKIVDLR